MTNDSEPKHYTLKLAFDLAQISTALRFNIIYDNNHHPAMQKVGRAAGGYHFHPGDKVTIEITASFNPERYSPTDISIQDLTLVCAPASNAHQPHLSPFDSESAGLMLKHWVGQNVEKEAGPMRPATVDPSPKFVVFKRDPATDASDPSGDLTVRPHDGQWQISGFLSVKVAATTHTAEFCRVFEFDPSVMVGNGLGG